MIVKFQSKEFYINYKGMQINNILVIVAIIIFIVAIYAGATLENSWRNVAITYGLLVVGIVLFSLALLL